MIILSHLSINKLSKRNSIIWSTLVSLNLVEPLNPWPSLFHKRMATSDKSLIYACSIEQSSANKILYPSSHFMLDCISGYKFFTKLDISSNIVPLSLLNQAKSFASLSHRLANTNTDVSPWDSNAPLTFFRKSWRKYYVMLKTPVYILMMLVPSCLPGNIISYNLTKYSTGWRPMASPMINNPFQCKWAIQETDWLGYWLILTGLKLWHIKSTESCKCRNPKTFHKCKVFLVL